MIIRIGRGDIKCMNTHGTEEDEVMEEELHLTAGILPTEKSIGCSKEILSSKCRTIKTQLRDVQKQSISNSRRELEEELEHLEGYSSKVARKKEVDSEPICKQSTPNPVFNAKKDF